MHTKRLLLAAALAAALFAGRLQAANSVAVMNLKALEGIDAFLPPLINELFCAKVPELGDYEVIAGPFIAEKIKESGNDELINCNRTDCYYLIGSGFEVKFMVTGTIGMQENAYIVNLMLLDVPNERVTRKVVRKYDGDQFGIVDELEKYLQELFGVAPEQQNVEVPAALQVDETPAPAAEESYENIVSEYAVAEPEIEETPSLTVTDESDTPEPARKKAGDDGRAPMPLPGERSMFRWCADQNREVILGSGYSLINLGEFSSFDFVKAGFRSRRNVIMLQFKMNSHEGSGFTNTQHTDRFDTTLTVSGGGIMYGFRLCQLFNGWVTVVPGATAGYFKYVSDIKVYKQDPFTGELEYYALGSQLIEKKSFFGANLQVDIGNQINGKLAAYAYTHAQLLWVKDPVFFLDFGVRLGYLLP